MTDAIPIPYPNEHDDDDIPWADPRIRIDYEAALGRLILTHNDVDLHLTLLIEKSLERLASEDPELQKLRLGPFKKRLDNLRTLHKKSPALNLHGLDFAALEEVNEQRNIVAHGHFEQNPYMGDYRLITNKETHKDFSIERLNSITERINALGMSIKPMVWFDFIEHELPEGARPTTR